MIEIETPVYEAAAPHQGLHSGVGLSGLAWRLEQAMRLLMISSFVVLSGTGQGQALETIASHQFAAHSNGYVCSADLVGSSGSHLGIKLSDYQGKWSLSFFISGRPEALALLYTDGNLADAGQLHDQLGRVQIGHDLLRSSSSSLMYAVKKIDLDENSTALVTIESYDSVVGAINSMQVGGLKFGDLVYFADTIEATDAFRSCGLAALGL